MGGFYRGIEASIMRACVLNATTMGVYEIKLAKCARAMRVIQLEMQ